MGRPSDGNRPVPPRVAASVFVVVSPLEGEQCPIALWRGAQGCSPAPIVAWSPSVREGLALA